MTAPRLRSLVIGSDIAEGTYAYVEVSDTGCGMDEKTRELLFEPFFTTKFTGRGLGLAAVRGVVVAHEGGLSLDSRPDRGSTIRVLLPVTDRTVEALGNAVTWKCSRAVPVDESGTCHPRPPTSVRWVVLLPEALQLLPKALPAPLHLPLEFEPIGRERRLEPP